MNKVIIIAEAGVNHNGDVPCAKEMINQAKAAGADIIKFQTFRSVKLASRDAQKAEYQRRNTKANENQLQMLKNLELNERAHKELLSHCRNVGIRFLSSPFDLDSLRLLKKLGLSLFKIPSGEITNYPYLKEMASYKKPIILSTGMAILGEIEAAIHVLLENGTKRSSITLLHCTTEYPTPYHDVNLRAMITMGNSFGMKFGYSDHTEGVEIPIAAVALGASVIEKHFTLDRNMEGPDHKASLEPDELRYMVKVIRNIEAALGDGIKVPTQSELKNKLAARKSLFAKRFINKGELFSAKNLSVMRPGNGISPMEWKKIVGRVASRSFKADEMIEW